MWTQFKVPWARKQYVMWGTPFFCTEKVFLRLTVTEYWIEEDGTRAQHCSQAINIGFHLGWDEKKRVAEFNKRILLFLQRPWLNWSKRIPFCKKNTHIGRCELSNQYAFFVVSEIMFYTKVIEIFRGKTFEFTLIKGSMESTSSTAWDAAGNCQVS